MTGASRVVVAWSLLSCLLGLAPTGFGGVPRAVNAVVFLLTGPGIALAMLMDRRYTTGSRRVLAPSLNAVISGTFSLTLLVLSSMTLLLVGAWSVPAVLGVVTAVAVVVAVLPAGSVPVEVLSGGSEADPVALPAASSDQVPAAARTSLPSAPRTAGSPSADERQPSDEIVMWS
jgi:hypothetical protein